MFQKKITAKMNLMVCAFTQHSRNIKSKIMPVAERMDREAFTNIKHLLGSAYSDSVC
jgi:hypothetical protein